MATPDLSNATCYYQAMASRIISIIVLLGAFALSAYETISGFNKGLEWYQLTDFQYRHSHIGIPLFVWILLALYFLIRLIFNAQSFFKFGPTLAISEEGLYYEFLGGNLLLVEWDDIDRFYGKDATSLRSTTFHNIYIELKDSHRALEHIKERLGTIPFAVRLQFALRSSTKPLRVFADSIENATRDQILAQLGTQLSEYRKHNSVHGT
jgi:hypothetical protein